MRTGIYIIAEAGVNHNGDVSCAKRMVDAAAKAGADAVKFQFFRADSVVIQGAEKSEYQKKRTGTKESQYNMLKKLEMGFNTQLELRSYCRVKGIDFLTSPFDLESLEKIGELGLDSIKIPSGEITNLPFLRKAGSMNMDIIMSTGMSELYEIKAAIDILTNNGTSLANISLLHCNTEYPTPFEDVNLKVIPEFTRIFPEVKIGFSDHTLGIEAAVAAAALGAGIIEKHFTLDRNMEGPDHKASLEPHQLAEMIRSIRNVERALGEREKRVTASELKNRDVARKSIVASRPIQSGEMFSEENLTVKRPGTGISPMRWDEIINKKAEKGYRKDDLI